MVLVDRSLIRDIERPPESPPPAIPSATRPTPSFPVVTTSHAHALIASNSFEPVRGRRCAQLAASAQASAGIDVVESMRTLVMAPMPLDERDARQQESRVRHAAGVVVAHNAEATASSELHLADPDSAIGTGATPSSGTNDAVESYLAGVLSLMSDVPLPPHGTPSSSSPSAGAVGEAAAAAEVASAPSAAAAASSELVASEREASSLAASIAAYEAVATAVVTSVLDGATDAIVAAAAPAAVSATPPPEDAGSTGSAAAAAAPSDAQAAQGAPTAAGGGSSVVATPPAVRFAEPCAFPASPSVRSEASCAASSSVPDGSARVTEELSLRVEQQVRVGSSRSVAVCGER